MKIIHNSSDGTKFVDLENGCVFTHGGCVYIKFYGNKQGNAVILEDGQLPYFLDDEIVTSYPSAFLTLE